MNKDILLKIRHDSFLCGGFLGSLAATLLIACMGNPILGIFVAAAFIAWGYVKYTDPKAKEVVDAAEKASAEGESSHKDTPSAVETAEKPSEPPAKEGDDVVSEEKQD